MKTFGFASLALALLMVSACTKSKELKNMVDPDAYVAKSDLQGKTFHLSRGVEDADSDNTVEATPGMSEDYGLVQARITENELQFISMFQPNGRPGTNKIVASYKISGQFDIKRDTNDYGNSTNKIVEDKTNSWQDRAYMRVDWANPTNALSKYANSLRLAADEDASGGDSDSSGNGLSEENTSLLEDPKFEKGHISFLVETSVKRAGQRGSFTFPMSESIEPAFRVVYRTHLMEVKPSDYVPVRYSLQDFERFGYFFTQQNFQDPRGLLEKNQNLFVNAHNVCEAGRSGSCSTNRIRWVLSKDFPEQYKAVARKVVKEWNATFQKDLNRTDDVVWLDESVQATISDPTMNVLALYPNRTKSGLLGVAQWVSDPRTGELNGVRATVYGDGIESVVASVDDKINLLVSDDPLKDVIGTSGFGSPVTYVSPFNDRGQTAMIAANAKTLKRKILQKGAIHFAPTNLIPTPSSIVRDARASMDRSPLAGSVRAMKLASKVPELLMPRDSALIADDAKTSNIAFPVKYAGFEIPSLSGMEGLLFTEAKLSSDKSALLHDAERGTHGTDLVEDAAIRYLYSYLAKGASKSDLEANRQRIKDEIRQLTFYTTALHEMGHAFGLRHNFAGSADKTHYPDEYKTLAAKMNPKSSTYDASVTAEDLAPYESSSIMDYTRDFFDQKNGLGSYDKAAIKYVYNRSINKDSDPITLAHYAFCTDHQVGENALCQRFDKGHNLSEMVAGDVDLYEHNYAMWHYRRGRISEGAAQQWGSPRALQMTLLSRVFLPVRQVMDEYLYSFVAYEPAEGAGMCGRKFIKASVDAGEMMPICSAADMAKAGVNPADLSTLVNALFLHDAQGNFAQDADGNKIRLKASSEYTPYGLADLVYSNALATDFFQRVIGSPEPGTYIAVPTAEDGFKLVAVSDDDDLKQVAAQAVQDQAKAAQADPTSKPMPAEIAQIFTTTPEQFTTEIKIGGYGRQYDTRTSTVGGWIRNDSLGSFYDKLTALRALSLPGMADKYSKDSLVGNAYVFPQTHAWTSDVFSKLITGESYVASTPVKLKGGVTISADVPNATSLDLQTYASLFALSYFASDTDKSMINKMMICDANQAECSNPGSQAGTVSYQSVDTGNSYHAFQSLDGDSISFKLVTAAKKNADDRAKFVAIRDAIPATHNNALQVMAAPETSALIAKIIGEVNADGTLAAFRFDEAKKIGWKEILPVQWKNLDFVTTNMLKISANQGYQVGSTVQVAFKMLEDQTQTTLTAMGPSGSCWVAKTHPEAIGDANKPQLSKDQIDARLEAKAAGRPIPASALTAVVPTCAGDAAQEAKDGATRYNLMVLLTDVKKVNSAYMATFVQAEIDSFRAPSVIDADTRSLRSKESQIDLIRKIVYQVTH